MRKNELVKIILETVKVVGILGIATVAPNTLQAMAKLGIIASPRQKDVVVRTRDRLVRSGHLRRDGARLKLTAKGERALHLMTLKYQHHGQSRKWDGKWRVVVFDIPEKRKGLRPKLRSALVSLGFYRLQNSVWVYPHECEDLLTLIKVDVELGREALYMIVDSIENDAPLRDHFQLSKRRS